jgi:hypothetical protein
MKCHHPQLDLMVDVSIACSLRWVGEVYPFKKIMAKSFQNCFEVPFNPKCIFLVIPSWW